MCLSSRAAVDFTLGTIKIMFPSFQAAQQQILGSESFPTLLISTFLLIITMVLLRTLMVRFLHRTITSTELQRKWLVQSRNGLLLLFLFGLLIIWGEELRTLALSLVALAVAFVIATKELILCVTGSVLKAGARSFDIGDRIQIRDFRGDVIDQNLLATTILEVGPGKLTHQRTGRMTVIPNSLFVSEPLVNESYTHDYMLHVFTVPFRIEDDWRAARQAFLEAAQRHSQPYLDDARKYMKQISRQRGLDMPSVDPRVTFQVPAPGEMELIVRVPTKAGQRGFLEQTILADVFRETDFTGPHGQDDRRHST